MRQFDVVKLTDGTLAVVLQSRHLDITNTCVVAPLMRSGTIVPIRRLHPTMRVLDQDLEMVTEKLGAVSRKDIADIVATVLDREWDIRCALDMVFTGF
jgi:CcdB protein